MKIPLIMNTSLHAYLEAMRQFPFLAKHSPQQYFRRPGKDFTRTRILHLERVVWLNIALLKCTLRVELDQFFDWLDARQFSPTKSAFFGSSPTKAPSCEGLFPPDASNYGTRQTG